MPRFLPSLLMLRVSEADPLRAHTVGLPECAGFTLCKTFSLLLTDLLNREQDKHQHHHHRLVISEAIELQRG